MKFQVNYTYEARNEIDAAYRAYRWILEHSKSSAIAADWFEGITAAIDSLERYPERCSLAPESRHMFEAIRQLLYGKRQGQYRVLFMIEDGKVLILHVRHSSREHLPKI